MNTAVERAQTRLHAGRETWALAWVAVQLSVIFWLARAFHLESPAFYNIVLPLTAGGFLIHHWLPRGWQPWFFAALSVAGVFLIFGLAGGAWLVGIGLGLIALCHVPIPFRWRIVLILLAAAGLVAMRAAWLPTPWPGAVWPVLGSMFMFRLGMYLYDLKHRGPGTPGFVLSYFFLLPNSVFLLFPVIDFQTFRRTHYDKPAFEIYGEGIRWMFRGLTHLVLYRLIYQFVALGPADVTSTATLVQYLVGNFGLYLRVSGQFHMIVGLLHLFGFRLPETHRFFYLASSFSDLWRRINIYWKDFMQKFVYLPVVFRLKRQSETTALVVATLCVVMATWLLHSYQWFWLLGEWLLSATDMAFWGVVGLLLIANTLREQRRGRERQLTAQAPASSHGWRHAVQTAGMFALMAFLWGVWTSPTFEDFRVMLNAATLRPFDLAVVLGTLGVVAAAAYLSHRFALGTPSALAVRPRWQHPLVVGALPLALLWVVGQPALEGRVPRQVQVVAQQARVAELNRNDAERMQRGYYERIVGVNRFNGELWEIYARADAAQEADDVLFADDIPFAEMMRAGPGDMGIWRRHDDELGHSLKPLNRTTFKGARFTTNQWGMRDRDYDKSLPPRTRRIAVLGQSYTMGAGVNDGETFEALIEEDLNRESSDKTGLQYEVLNFAVSGYTLDKQLLILQNGLVAGFQPKVVLLVGNPGDERAVSDSLVRQLKRGVGLPDSVAATMKQAGVTESMSVAQAQRLLHPHWQSLVRWALENIAFEARRIGAQPVYALIPMPRDRPQAGEVPDVALAAQAGFLVIDLEDVYAGHDPRLLAVSDFDFHPNATGHRVIADRLYREMSNLPPGILSAEDPADAEHNTRHWAEWNRSQVGVREVPEQGPERGRGDRGNRGAAEGGRAGRGTNAGGSAASLPIEGWEIAAREGNGATLVSQRAENWMRVTIDKLTSRSPASIRLRTGPVSVTRNHRYVLKFFMQADAVRSVTCGLASGTSPDMLLGASTRVDAGTWWQEFSCAFRATATDANARIFFDLGTSQAAVELSRVELHDLSTGSVLMSTDPAGKPPTPKGR